MPAKTEIRIDGRQYIVDHGVYRYINSCFNYLDGSPSASVQFTHDSDGIPIRLVTDQTERPFEQQVVSILKDLGTVSELFSSQRDGSRSEVRPVRPPPAHKSVKAKGTRARRRQVVTTEVGRENNKPIYSEALKLIPPNATKSEIKAALIRSGLYAKSTAVVMVSTYYRYLEREATTT